MSILKDFTRSDAAAERRRKIELGKQSFRDYCNLINPEFFRSNRQYQTAICHTLQAMYRRELINPDSGKPYDILIVNLPPGFGKSYTASLFSTWAFGDNPKNKVITISYAQDLAISFSKTVRDTIQDEEIQGENEYFAPVSFFSKLRIKQGDGAMDKWALEGSYMSYLGTSFGGKLTGMRGNIIIIDDPIKNAAEALNENVKDSHWDFYKNTLMSRLLPNALQIIIQTRWATDDLAGRIESEFPERCYVLKMSALDEDDNSLCDEIYPAEDLIQKRAVTDEHIWSANFMQIPIDLKGVLYGEFKTYMAVDTEKFERFIAYIDTADEGVDFLCCIMGGVIDRYGYITDIYYTDEGMEITEPETARKLTDNKTRDAIIESNNGGRGYARNVERELKRLKNKKCNITWFHQSKNKRTRILVNATNVMEQIIMPEDWRKRWPRFYKALSSYQRKGRNDHDDAPDALTGFVEFINGEVKGKKKMSVLKRRTLGL